MMILQPVKSQNAKQIGNVSQAGGTGIIKVCCIRQRAAAWLCQMDLERKDRPPVDSFPRFKVFDF
jgi:hypothetical protein